MGKTHQISPTYVMIGASIRPTPSPKRTFATKISYTSLALYIISQAITWGIFTKNIARLRPSGSAIKPDIKLPTGWQMNAILAVSRRNENYLRILTLSFKIIPNHDACEGDSRKYSLVLCWFKMPVVAGITIAGNASVKLKSNNSRFLIVLAKICEWTKLTFFSLFWFRGKSAWSHLYLRQDPTECTDFWYFGWSIGF